MTKIFQQGIVKAQLDVLKVELKRLEDMFSNL